MIEIISHFTVKENCLDKVLDIFGDVIEQTNSNDTGFSEYDLYQNANDPLELVILEKWDSQEALDAHSAQEYVKQMGPRIQPYMDNISFGFYKKIK